MPGMMCTLAHLPCALADVSDLLNKLYSVFYRLCCVLRLLCGIDTVLISCLMAVQMLDEL